MENTIDLSIIILNYNGEFWLSKLLPNLRKNYLDRTKYVVEVIVVDNDSTDDSADVINCFKWVKFMESGQNGGYAFGNNIALKNNQARYVMLLNSDTEFPDEGSNLDLLIDYLDQYKAVGVITPGIVLSNDNPDQACHRGEPTPWAGFCYFTGLEKLFPKSKIFGRYHQGYKDLNIIHQIDACSGAAMIIRTSAIKEVGLLDERFFMYAEDVDWCKRFREAGYQIVYNPEVKVIHYKYKSGIQNENVQNRSKTIIRFYETMLQYYDKHYAEKYPGFFRILLKVLIAVKKKNDASNLNF